MPRVRRSKPTARPSPLAYIVVASDADHRIGAADLAKASARRDAQQVFTLPDGVTVEGVPTARGEERGDLHLMRELMAHLASVKVAPADRDAPFCTAFAHTSRLSLRATRDGVGLAFDEPLLLRQIFREAVRTGSVFAPFAAPHVRKVVRVTRAAGGHTYGVEMCVLTGLGVLVVRGVLRVDEKALASHDVRLEGAQINWQSWGFDAQRRWATTAEA